MQTLCDKLPWYTYQNTHNSRYFNGPILGGGGGGGGVNEIVFCIGILKKINQMFSNHSFFDTWQTDPGSIDYKLQF